MEKNWIYKEPLAVSKELKDYVQDDLFLGLLASRGIDTVDRAQRFLEPQKYYEEISPYAFTDMNKVVERVSKAIATDEKIVIFGDFDADGVTSTSLLVKALKYLGANVDFYIPSRQDEGHGLNSAALIKLRTKLQVGLVITVDCGISNNKEISLVNNFGVDVIITDHHSASDELPDAFAIINPKALNSIKNTLPVAQVASLNYLAGVGVAYKVAQALLEKYDKKEFEKELLPLVAIGTIADVVPLLEENRLLVNKGIDAIKKYKPAGIKALMDVAGHNIEGFDSQSIAFGIAPRVNAIGRLEHPAQVVELFTTDNEQRIPIIARYMDDCNKIRQGLCENILEEALDKIEQSCDLKKNKAIIISDSDWHIGIIGIVASKLCEKFYRPVIIIRVDEEASKLRCSARGIKGLNLYEAFSEVQEHLEIFGGHALAAGFSTDKKNLEVIVKELHQVINESLDDEFLTPCIEIDKKLQKEDLAIEFIEKLKALEPCGEKNPSPLFSLEQIKLQDMKTMGANSNHLKLFFESNLEGVFWGKSEIEAQRGDVIDVVFSAQLNTFMNKTTVQLMLQDYKSEALKASNDSQLAPKVKLVDHRKKENALELFLNYLKVTKTSISIFAEHKNTIENLSNRNIQGANIVNRLNLDKVDQLVFLDLPPDKATFDEMLKKSQAKVVHLLGQSKNNYCVDELLKTCCGMLKYADSNLDGVIEIELLASRLYLSSDALNSCLNLLEKAEVIDVLNTDETSVEIKFLQSKEMAFIQSFNEYKLFQDAVGQMGEIKELV